MKLRLLLIVLVLLPAARSIADSPETNALVNLQDGETAEQFKARTELEARVQMNPEDKPARARLIAIYAALPKQPWDVIERLINEGRALPGEDANPYWPEVESSMWFYRSQPDKAVKAMQQAVKVARAGDDKSSAEDVFKEYLTTLAKAKHFKELAKESDGAFERNRQSADAPLYLMMRAMANAGMEKKDLAADDFNEALKLAEQKSTEPVVDVIQQSLADTLGIDLAIAQSQKLQSAGTPHRQVMLGYLQLKAHDDVAASKTVDKLLARPDKLLPPEKLAVLGLAGSVYMQGNRYNDAVGIYKELIELDPKDTIALNNLACLYTDYVEPAQPVLALRFSRKMINLAWETRVPQPSELDTHGWALVLNGRIGEGLEYLNAALAQIDSAETHYHIGMARLKQGRKDDARREIEKAKQMLDADKASKKPVEERVVNHVKAALEGLST